MLIKGINNAKKKVFKKSLQFNVVNNIRKDLFYLQKCLSLIPV